MDPFTQRMMERARQRREKLDHEMAALGHAESKRKRVPLLEMENTEIIEKTATEERSPEKEKDSSNLTSKLTRLGKLYSESNDNFNSPVHKTSETLSRYQSEKTSSSRSARLAALAQSIEAWEDDLSHITPTPKRNEAPKPVVKILKSPIKASVNNTLKIASPVKSVTPVKMPTRALVSSPAQSPIARAVLQSPVVESSPAKRVESPAKSAASPLARVMMESPAKSPVSKDSPNKGIQMGLKSPLRGNTKPVVWDQAVLATLEAQGFVPTLKRTRLIYDFNNQDEDSICEESGFESPSAGSVRSPGWVYKAGSPAPKMGVQSPVSKASRVNDTGNISPGSVLQRAAMFEKSVISSPQIDPAELPLSQRMALFEKNKSQGPLIPKVAFSTPLPAKLIPQTEKSSVASKPVQIEKPKIVAEKSKPVGKIVQKTLESNISKPMVKQQVDAKDTKVLAQKAMFEQHLKVKHTEVVAASLAERKQELDQLRSRWDMQKQLVSNEPHQERVEMEKMRQRWEEEVHTPPPPPPPMPVAKTPQEEKLTPSKKYPGVEEVRKIRLSPPKQGKIYPSLSDIEATESELDSSGSSQQSDGSLGEEILKAAGVRKLSIKRAAVELNTSECAVMEEMDEMLEQALEDPTPPKKSRDEHVFIEPRSTPLVYSVSVYRKQQSQGTKLATPVKQIVRQPESDEESEEDVDEKEQKAIQKKLKEYYEQISAQQTIISQASQALNLCRSTIEFSNSPEQVEAERLLLVATHKRQALLHEIERLKVEGTLHAHGSHLESGTLIINNLALPMKQEVIMRSLRDDIEHYVVCLVKCQEQVVSSSMMAASSVNPQNPILTFPGSITLNNLGSDFAIKLEAYTLQTRRETLSHEIKYHIKKDVSGKKRMTPKKQKHDNLLVMPMIQSPAGPSAVRSPSFMLAGYTVFSLREMKRTQFILNKVPSSSPLEGHVTMNLCGELRLEIEQRGFLTMFDDISGFGAWHRRWCVLQGSRLSYWKYPDDERIKEPIGSLELRNSCTKNVGAVARDICARPYTFLLETRREPRSDDRETLVMIPYEGFTVIRHLLSADTREERDQWCNELNRALSSIRAWRASSTSV